MEFIAPVLMFGHQLMPHHNHKHSNMRERRNALVFTVNFHPMETFAHHMILLDI